MKRFTAVLFVLSLILTAPLSSGEPLRFSIKLSPELAERPLGGRLFVFMSASHEKRDRLTSGFIPGFIPGPTWLAATEVDHFEPGSTVRFDPDQKAFPRPFSSAAPGDYQFMALLDLDHSFARSGQGEGDLYSEVVQTTGLNPANTAALELVLQKRTEARRLPEREGVQLVEMVSKELSAFWGRPITMRAGVVVPPDYDPAAAASYAAVYHISGFGGDHQGAWWAGPRIREAMAAGTRLRMIHVFLDASCPSGHHVFADSVNNGPWSTALVREFIPFLESSFRLVSEPYARFLTGHSSGGWSSLWLQVTHPDFFGGTWSTSPDPVDFRSFTGIDVSPGSTQNVYRTGDGKLVNLVRKGTKEIASFRDFVLQEEVAGDYGGQISSFEWVFSPRGQDGRPMKLFDRVTGVQDPEVQAAWQKYDIRLLLERNWQDLSPKLQGKVHLICGSEDTFHLEEAFEMLCSFLQSKGWGANCELVPGRDHEDLYNPYSTYPDGLAQRIDDEMGAALRAARAKQAEEAASR